MRTFLALIVILTTFPAMAQQPQQGKPDMSALIKAAEQGDADAQFKLGTEYTTGLNVAQDFTEAAKWLGKAAELSNGSAQFALGALYAQGGNNFQKDYVQAYTWMELAADTISRDENDAGRYGKIAVEENYRQKLAKEMTPDQITESQRLARDWRLKHGQDPVASNGPPKMTAPVPLSQPFPAYTDEARQAGVEGFVLIQCIVRKDGTVDSPKIIKGLGYGLDESAIRTITTSWRFRPGTVLGKPVDVQANVQVRFQLYKKKSDGQ
jgi:TonB family protein